MGILDDVLEKMFSIRHYSLFDNLMTLLISAIPTTFLILVLVVHSTNMEVEAAAENPSRIIYEVIPQEEVEEVPEDKVYQTVVIDIDGVQFDTGLTAAEIDLIAGTTFYEAGNQDFIGKRLVVDAILNRLDSELFPDTVEQVIYQHNSDGVYQFAVAKTGVLDTGMDKVTDECYQAVYKELVERLDLEAIYFNTGGFTSYGRALYQHGQHYFSAVKEGK